MEQLSYTALSTYEQCPLKYKFNYIDKMSEIYHRDRSYFSFGETLHTVLTKFFQIKDINKRTLGVLHSLLRENWISKGYDNPNEEFEYYNIASSILEKFYESNDIKIQPLYLNDFFCIPLESFILTGRIDRIDILSDKNEIEIIDYKTGKFLPDYNEIIDDKQLLVYSLAVLKKYHILSKKASFLYLYHNKKISIYPTREQIDNIKKYIVELYYKIKQETKFLPKESKFCRTCDYLVICPLLGLGIRPTNQDRLKYDYKETIRYLESIRNDLYTLNKLSLNISSIIDKHLLIKRALEIVSQLSNVTKAVFLIKENNDIFKVHYSINYNSKLIFTKEEIDKLINNNYNSEIDVMSSSVIVLDLDKQLNIMEHFYGDSDLETLIMLPLKIRESLLGIIFLLKSNRKVEFTNYNITLLQSLSLQIAVSLYNSQLYELAVTDGLTGLYTHRYFQQQLEQEMEKTKKYNLNLCMLLFDIDYFKKLNDTYGHPEGDNVLKFISNMLKENFREKDIIARYGGEEFVVIMPDTDLDTTIDIADKFRNKIENYIFNIKNENVKITISAGAGLWDRSITKEQFIEQVDNALYNAKKLGRNRICV